MFCICIDWASNGHYPGSNYIKKARKQLKINEEYHRLTQYNFKQSLTLNIIKLPLVDKIHAPSALKVLKNISFHS